MRNSKKASKPVAAPVAAPVTDAPAKPVAFRYDYQSSYTGASKPVRASLKLKPVRLDYAASNVSERDLAFLRDQYQRFAQAPFARANLDAGNIGRAIAFGYVKHVSGALDAADATFAITDKAISERFKKA